MTKNPASGLIVKYSGKYFNTLSVRGCIFIIYRIFFVTAAAPWYFLYDLLWDLSTKQHRVNMDREDKANVVVSFALCGGGGGTAAVQRCFHLCSNLLNIYLILTIAGSTISIALFAWNPPPKKKSWNSFESQWKWRLGSFLFIQI